MPSWCGPKKATLALLDGYGGNSWRQVTTASGKQSRSNCARASPTMNMPTARATRKSRSPTSRRMAAKGIDALVVFGDAGPAVLPAITSVYKSGKVIVPYRVDVGGKEGVNYTKFIGSVFRERRRELGQLDQERPAQWRQPAVPQRPCRQQPGPRRTDGPEDRAWARIQVRQPGALRRDQLGSGADPEGADGRNRQERQDRRDRFRLRSVAGRRAAAVQQVRPVDPGAGHIRRQFAGLLLDREPEGQSGLQAVHRRDRQTTTCAWPCNGRSRRDRRQAAEEEIFKAPVFENSVSGKPNPVQCRKDLPGAIYLSSKLSPEDQAKAVSTK